MLALMLLAAVNASDFRFDEATGTCRDAEGREGLNAGPRPGPCVDLSGADLRGKNLAGLDLRGAQLSNADLRGARLAQTNLSWASLSNVKVAAEDLACTTLVGATLEVALLRSVARTKCGVTLRE